MPTLQSSGIGSGLDIASLVSQLVAAERAPHDARLTRQETKATLQISALGSLKGALSTFKSALESLKTESAFNPHTATSGDLDIYTATASDTAATGTYDIEVVALAKAHQLTSEAFADGASAVVGTGTLTITQGSKSFNIVIDSSNNTLAGIREAINKASDNTGVQATLLYSADGARLALTATTTGAANAIKVAQSDGDGGLEQLVYDPEGTMNLTEKQPAQDSHIRVAGFDKYSTTNTVSDAIDGVTLTLKKDSAGEVIPLTITNDTATINSRIQKFVTEYNKLQQTFSSLRGFSSASGSAGPLLGDALLRGIEQQIRQDLSNPVSGTSGAYTSLASIGITRQTDGTLTINNDKLTAALNADRAAVARIFGSSDGVAARLYEHIEDQLASDSAIEARNQSLQKTIKTVQTDREALDARMELITERYRKQFTALDSLLANMQSTSNYLASQLASLPGAAK